jgi:hypothetical protein
MCDLRASLKAEPRRFAKATVKKGDARIAANIAFSRKNGLRGTPL